MIDRYIPTQIQRKIEDVVTGGRGYDRNNTGRTPWELRDSEIDVQVALANMECSDGNMHDYEILEFGSRLKRVIDNFRKIGLPTDVIRDAEGFKIAMKSAYNLPIDRLEPSFGSLSKYFDEKPPLKPIGVNRYVSEAPDKDKCLIPDKDRIFPLKEIDDELRLIEIKPVDVWGDKHNPPYKKKCVEEGFADMPTDFPTQEGFTDMRKFEDIQF